MSTARPYRSALEHLDDNIALVSKLVERQIYAHQQAGLLPKVRDAFSGTFVSPDEAHAALGPPQPGDGERKLADLDAALVAFAERIEARLAATTPALGWQRLAASLALTPTEQRALWVLIVTELSARHRALMRYLVNEASRVYPDVGLLEMLVYGAPGTREALLREMAPDATLFRYRLVEPVGSRRQLEDAPFLLRMLKVNPRVLELVSGMDRIDRDVAAVGRLITEPPGGEHLRVDEALRNEVTALCKSALTAGRPTPMIVLTGAEGGGRKALVYAAARALGRPVLLVRCADLPRDGYELGRLTQSLLREAKLAGAITLLEGVEDLAAAPEDGRPDRGRWLDGQLASYAGAVLATAARTDGKPMSSARGLVIVEVPLPNETVRRELWLVALGAAGDVAAAESAAARYGMTGGLIQRAAESAKAIAQSRGEAVSPADVHAGVRSTLDVKMSKLGVRVMWRQTWDDLVLPEDTLLEIREFIARVKHRRQVYETWGFARKVAKGLGLSALFTGPPGTGKTMVAGIIADALSLDLYQVDLSKVVSKYVGETEKNLSALFDAAEVGHSIILFDEADSLFAKRTEVKSSIDRYANLEVNYLLQRMEAFAGITILTTNLDTAIDEAFRRRLSFRVDFPMPEEEEREKLWRAMIPTAASVARDVDWQKLSTKFEMSGGYIKNAVVRAAFLAADEGESIAMKHLLRGGSLEYAAMGKIIAHGGR